MVVTAVPMLALPFCLSFFVFVDLPLLFHELFAFKLL